MNAIDKYRAVVDALAEIIALMDEPPVLFTDAKELLEALSIRMLNAESQVRTLTAEKAMISEQLRNKTVEADVWRDKATAKERP